MYKREPLDVSLPVVASLRAGKILGDRTVNSQVRSWNVYERPATFIAAVARVIAESHWRLILESKRWRILSAGGSTENAEGVFQGNARHERPAYVQNGKMRHHDLGESRDALLLARRRERHSYTLSYIRQHAWPS